MRRIFLFLLFVFVFFFFFFFVFQSPPRRKVRCVGSALSPNGLAFEERGMISLSLLDRILEIDEANKTVTVEGGARVQPSPTP